jgi:hypothetical protein
LAAHIGGINCAGQELAGLEERLFGGGDKQVIEFHAVIMP